MPRYIYHCKRCDNEFETSHSITERLEDCEECDEEGALFRVPSFFVMKKEEQASNKTGDIVKSKIEEFKQDLKEEKKAFQEKEYK